VNKLSDAITHVIIGVILVAIIVVIFSQKSQTSALVQSFGSAFDGALSIAEAPITNNQGVVATSGATGGTANISVISSQLLQPLTTSLPTLAVTPLGFGGIGVA
jgi:hypothetical protein